MYKLRWMLGVLLISSVLWGCGDNTAGKAVASAENGLEIEVLKDGSIVETITEEFGKEYYDAANLKNMLLTDVEDFNRGLSGGNVTVDQFESEGGVLVVSMKYPSPEAYTAYNTDTYNHKALYNGTIAQAQEAGYSFDISLTDVKGDNEIGKDDILGMGSSKVLIAEFPSLVKVAGKILYVGENVEALGKDRALMKADENGGSLGRYYVVYK